MLGAVLSLGLHRPKRFNDTRGDFSGWVAYAPLWPACEPH
jgi:hypothetical protein